MKKNSQPEDELPLKDQVFIEQTTTTQKTVVSPNRKTGPTVSAIIFTILSILLFAATIFFTFSIVNNVADSTVGQVTSVLLLATYGLIFDGISFLLAIIGIVCSAIGCTSSKKANKVWSIICLILNIIIIIGLIAAAIFVMINSAT